MESLFKLRNLPPVKEADPFESWEETEDGDQKTSSSIDLDTCPHCFNTDCLYTSDLVTCKECGSIVSRPFDNTAEYRYFVEVIPPVWAPHKIPVYPRHPLVPLSLMGLVRRKQCIVFANIIHGTPFPTKSDRLFKPASVFPSLVSIGVSINTLLKSRKIYTLLFRTLVDARV
jgi:ribosomal protein S27E